MTRVAVIGAGYFGQFHYDAWKRMEDCELVAACALQGAEETAAEHGISGAFTDVAEMLRLARPDLVDITTPPETHLDMIRAVSPHVDWIICQKPFCGGLNGARMAVAHARSAKVRLAVHENFRFQPWYRQIRLLLEEGAIGEIYQASFRLRPGDGQGADAYLARQPYFQEMPRFLVHETGIHWIDTFRFLLGEVTSISADLRQLNPVIAGEDAAVIQMAFGNGARALFDGNRLADHVAGNRRLTMGEMEIEGSGGSIRLDGNAGIWLRPHDSNEWSIHRYDWNDHRFGGDCVYLTNRAILEAFRAECPAETEAASYLRNIELVEAVYQSHAERRWIDV